MTEIKFKTIVKISEKIKSHVEKNHVLPGKVTVDKVEYTYPTAAYLIANGVVNPGKDVELLKMSKAPAPSGETVDLKLTTNEYKSLAKNLITFMKPSSHRRLPNFLTCKSKQIKQRVFIYSFAKIVVFYSENNRLPTSCKFRTSETVAKSTSTTTSTSSKTSTSTKKGKHGHATKHGCDNMGQNNGYYCGVHSLQEIIRNLTGKVISQSKLAGWAGTTTSGTDHQGLLTALAKAAKELGVKFKAAWYNFSELGWSGIKKIVKSSNQDCLIHNLYRNQWGHYEVINGVSDSNIKVQNSLGSKCTDTCYCGYVEDRTPSTFRSYIKGISQKSVLVVTLA
ncbi:MAG: hypothetical protein J6M08_05735 [Methanobrevibacter sp.]|nr:hypothetical protein [Methanobrevibacter sp.]